MMYSNNFVVCVLQNGQVIANSKQGNVALPFSSEYQIRLRNKNNRRAVAKVFIDGDNVSEGGLVVDAYSYVDLDCHVGSKKRFLLAATDSPAAVAEGKDNKDDDSNGVI